MFKKDLKPWKTRGRMYDRKPEKFKKPYKPSENFELKNINKINWKEHVLKSRRAFDQGRNLDPREVVLSWASKAEEDKLFTTAYNKTQPKNILDFENNIKNI